MKTVLLLASLLVIGAVAVAPTASADHIHCEGPQIWLTACDVGNAGYHYADCYYQTAPKDWASTCL